jgi:hypothetical protein
MDTLSLDLRRRIVSAYDQGEGIRDEIALRFRVSLEGTSGLGVFFQTGVLRCEKKRHWPSCLLCSGLFSLRCAEIGSFGGFLGAFSGFEHPLRVLSHALANQTGVADHVVDQVAEVVVLGGSFQSDTST